MSHIAAHGHAHPGHVEPHVEARRHLDTASVTLAPGAGRMASTALFFIGLLALIVLGVAGASDLRHLMGAYHTGVLYATGVAVACLGLQMVFQQFNAGWAAGMRRQAENVASCVWVCAVLFAPILILDLFVFHGKLFKWMDPALTDPSSPAFDMLAVKKKPFLNGPFFALRAVLYFGLWIWLARSLARLSLRQDETGDKWLTAKARHMSSYGLLIFALTIAFAAFDWVMSLDYHWYSTMFGVYFFAGSMRAAVALLIVILSVLMLRGRLNGAFNKEHLHDAGKLLFAFTAFWAYIAFSQYFLIWYSNIPEETAWFNLRVSEGWQPFPVVMTLFNFVIPFLLLLIRDIKRSARTMLPVAALCLVAFAMDLYFAIRPAIGEPGRNVIVDVAGMLAPVCILMGFAVRRIVANPLVPLKDPRLHEVLEHKNYV